MLTVRTRDLILAVLEIQGRRCVAAGLVAEMGCVPARGRLAARAADTRRRGTITGRRGPWLFVAGTMPAGRPVDWGANWHVADDGEFWLAWGPVAEVYPQEWEHHDGRRSPTRLG